MTAAIFRHIIVKTIHVAAAVFALSCVMVHGPSQKLSAAECVRIYYDAIGDNDKMTYFARVHGMYLENVLGHFPHLQTILSPISKYNQGDIEKCKSTIYVSTYYDAPIPSSFLDDFVKTEKNVAWAGYNIWKMGAERLEQLWGVKFNGLTTLDTTNRDSSNRPGFYRFYSYKGEEFEKYGEWDPSDPTRFHAAFEIAKLELINPANRDYVLSWARHSTSEQQKELPYALNKGHKWYFGDSPFSYAVESDRYLIFCDLLFDILNEPPRRTSGPKPALFRVEDVHPMIPLWQLFNMIDVLKKHSVPFTINIIPIFTDPFGLEVSNSLNRFVPITRDKVFRDAMDYARQAGASFFYHGLTHQYGHTRNPFSGVTGDDFEFWDRVKNTAIAGDSAAFARNRLEDGVQLLELAGIRPVGWVTPHYQASPLDYNIFSQFFSWTAGRSIYFPFKKTQANLLPEKWTIDKSMTAGREARLKYTTDLTVSYDTLQFPNGQFYPFEIFGDIYGQRVIPENVGNVQAFMNEQVLKTLTVDGMIANLKRNRNLRDAWGSFFIHPFCISALENAGIGAFPGDVSEIERLIKATRDYGYEFVDITTWIYNNTLPKRLPTIEVQP